MPSHGNRGDKYKTKQVTPKICPARPAQRGDNSFEDHVSRLFKDGLLMTEFCPTSKTRANCPHGSRCRYAHRGDNEELRVVNRVQLLHTSRVRARRVCVPERHQEAKKEKKISQELSPVMTLQEAAATYRIDFIDLIANDKMDNSAVPLWHLDIFARLRPEEEIAYMPWLCAAVPECVRSFTFTNFVFPEPCCATDVPNPIERPEIRSIYSSHQL